MVESVVRLCQSHPDADQIPCRRRSGPGAGRLPLPAVWRIGSGADRRVQPPRVASDYASGVQLCALWLM